MLLYFHTVIRLIVQQMVLRFYTEMFAWLNKEEQIEILKIFLKLFLLCFLRFFNEHLLWEI